MKDHFINNLNKSIEFTDFICRISLIDCNNRGLDISYYCLQYKTHIYSHLRKAMN
jgi:hypothetical protein